MAIINNYSPIKVEVNSGYSQSHKTGGEYGPTAFTDTEVNNCFSIYHTSRIISRPKYYSNFRYPKRHAEPFCFFLSAQR